MEPQSVGLEVFDLRIVPQLLQAREIGLAARVERVQRPGGPVRCAVLPRDGLEPGFERPGPLIIEAMDTTVVVPPGWRCRADARGFILLEAMS